MLIRCQCPSSFARGGVPNTFPFVRQLFAVVIQEMLYNLVMFDLHPACRNKYLNHWYITQIEPSVHCCNAICIYLHHPSTHCSHSYICTIHPHIFITPYAPCPIPGTHKLFTRVSCLALARVRYLPRVRSEKLITGTRGLGEFKNKKKTDSPRG